MESVRNSVVCVGLLYDQLAVVVCNCSTLDVTFLVRSKFLCLSFVNRESVTMYSFSTYDVQNSSQASVIALGFDLSGSFYFRPLFYLLYRHIAVDENIKLLFFCTQCTRTEIKEPEEYECNIYFVILKY